MANLEQGMTPDMEKAYNGFIAQRMVAEENQSGKVNKTLDYNAATGDIEEGRLTPVRRNGPSISLSMRRLW